jgi:hypothetical protein
MSKGYVMECINTYEELLREQGFQPQRTQAGDLSFKYEGQTYLIIVDEKDPRFFHLLYTGVWKIETPEVLREALEVCNQLTSGRKVAKVFVTQDRAHVNASVELFVPEPATMRPLFMRALNSLEFVVREFRDQLRRGIEDRSSAQLRMLVRRRFVEMLTKGDLSGVRMLFTDDYVCVDPSTPPGGWPAGPVAAVAQITAYRSAFGVFQLTIHQQYVAGAVVITHWSLTGRQDGPLLGMLACKQEVTLNAISLDELRGHQIAYTLTTYDCGSIARELLARPVEAR